MTIITTDTARDFCAIKDGLNRYSSVTKIMMHASMNRIPAEYKK